MRLIFLAVVAALALNPILARADSLATPVINRQGTSLTVNGVDGGYPVAITGTISASNPSVGSNAAAIPTSSTLIGGKDGSGNLQAIKVNGSSALTVDGSAVTQPVSGTLTAVQGTGTNLHVVVDSAPSTAVTGTVTATQATGSNLHVQVDTAPTTAVTGTFFQSTQPISSAIQDPAYIAPAATSAPSKAVVVMGKSADGTPAYNPIPLAAGSGSVVVGGTVTANAGSNLNTSALALDATLTGRTQKAQITDGTRDGTVKAASTAAAATDTSVVVALHPSSPLPTGANVIGHVIADTGSTTAVTGNVTAVQPTGTNLHAVLDTTSTTAVTQATGTNLHAVLDTTSTTAVTQATAANLNATVVQATGTNLHAVLDTTSTTAATQATAANLNALVAQGAAGAAAWKVDGSAVTQPVSTADTAPVNQALGALNAACTLTMAGQASAGFQLAAGTLIGTIIPEISHDNGTTYNATFFDDPATGNKVSSIVFGGSNTATDRTIVGAGGQDHVRVRVSAYTSGTAGCLIRGSATSDPSLLFTGAAGSPAPIVGQVGGKDGSGNVQPFTMKAASTAAAAADISAVVALHPSSPLPTGSNVIGHVIADTGSTTAVTGNVTAVQATGTNLHAVLDTTSTTAVTQATGTNLHAVLDATSTTAVTQATGTNLHVVTDATSVLAANQSVNTSQIGGSNTATAGTGVQKVGVVGNTAATVDATLAAGTAPTNGLGVIAQYNTAAPAPTNAQSASIQADQAGNLLGFLGVQTKTGTVWTSATAQNTLQFPTGTATVGAPLSGAAILVQLVQTTTITVGAVTFQGTYDGTNWVTIPVAQVLNPQTMAALTNPYTLVASTNQPFLILPQGFQQIRANLTTAITGSGSVSPFWTVLSNAQGAPSAQGAPNTAANAWPHKITDGTSTAAVKAASTAAAATDPALVVAVSPNNSVAVTQATGTNLHAVLDTTSTTACTQATGTNLHVVTDATSVLAANQSVNMAQVAGTNTVNGGVAGTLGVGGVSATNTAITQNPMLIAAESNDGAAQPAASTTGRQRQLVSTVDGQLVVRPFGTVVWHCSLNAIAASLTQCQAVPGAGLSLYVTDLVVVTTTTTAGTYSWQTGTGSNCGTGTAAVFPGDATGTRFTAPISTSPPTVIHFGTPIKLGANTALCLIGVATNTIHAEATGFSAP